MRFIVSLSIACAVAVLTATPAASQENYLAQPDDYGNWAVGHEIVSVVDADRENRTLPTRIWYPVDPEDAGGGTPTFYPLLGPIGITSVAARDGLPITDIPFRPLIVFSHGSTSFNFQSIILVETLASHGFIVAAPDHVGNTQTDLLNGTLDPFPVVSRNRPLDISAVIDYVLARSWDPNDSLFLHVNPLQIGVTGHSFGGYTALAMAAGYEDVPPDLRVGAILPVSATTGSFSDEDLASINIPALHLGGTLDTLVPIDPNTIRAWENLSTPDVFHYRADIIGATHSHFAAICDIANALISVGLGPAWWPLIGASALIGPYNETCVPSAFPIAEAVRLQNLYSVAFFKVYTNWDLRYQLYLTNGYAVNATPDVDFFRGDPNLCGLGFELVFVLPPLVWARRRWKAARA